MITNEQLAEIRAAASTAHNDIIRSHGWDGFVEELDALAKDEAYLLLASPETMLALLDNIDAKAAELAEWHKLKDPNALHINMLAGMPARLSAETLLHLAGDQYQGMAARIAELEREVEEANEARREAQLAAQEAQTSRDSAVTKVRRELGQRIAYQEKDAARYRALRDGLLSGLDENPMACAMESLGERVCDERGHDAIPTATEFDAAIDAVMEPPRCTCPSGDGSLRWPCQRHPPESA
ncbi:hypothetical protein [Chromobacterium haemolyticum]|uniref:hypothetical protein n=1 Tax=Chromobacterium haemolyticum TaxID=394935 RepID=UPI000594DE1D|nr:hypothetical protein [Chromobacterium haemolyticum]